LKAHRKVGVKRMGEFTLQKATGKLTGEFFLGKNSLPAKDTHKLSATLGKSNSELPKAL